MLILLSLYSSSLFLANTKYWSVRISKEYRAVGIEVEKGISWFWVGTHAEYERLIGKK